MPSRRDRRLFSKKASEKEKERVYLEQMGLDCKEARDFYFNRGVTEQELRILATGRISDFLKIAGHKLTEKERQGLMKKYK